MKKGIKRWMAVFTASLTLLTQSPGFYYAETTTGETTAAETSASMETPAAAPAETAAAAPTETAAPAETSASETAASPETQAPEQTQAATGTQEETAVQEPDTASGGSDSLITDGETTAASESSETQAVTEKTTETETADTFSCTGDGFTARLSFMDGTVYPKSSVLSVQELSPEERDPAEKMLRAQADKGHRELAGFRVYTVTLKNADTDIALSDNAVLSITFTEPQSLELLKNKNARAEVFSIGKEAQYADHPPMDENLCVSSFQISADNLKTFALAGVTDLVNDGETVSRQDLQTHLKDFRPYAVVTNTYEQDSADTPAAEPEMTAAGSGTFETGTAAGNAGEVSEENTDTEETDTSEAEPRTGSADTEEKPDAAKISSMLTALSSWSLKLANAQSSDTVTVVNLFADESGRLDTAPLEEIMSSDGTSIDVTNQDAVINIVAASENQDLVLPSWNVTNSNAASSDEKQVRAGTSGRVIYNLTALDENGSYTAYTGHATLKTAAAGTYLAPTASLFTVQKQLTGAVYAGSVHFTSGASVTASLYGASSAEETAKEPDAAASAKAKAAPAMETENEDNSVQPRMITLRVGAVDEESLAGRTVYLGGAGFYLYAKGEDGTITDIGADPASKETESTAPPAVKAQAEAGESTGIAVLTFDAAKIPQGAALYLKETLVPDGYYISEPEDTYPKVIALTEDGTVAAGDQPVQIKNREASVSFRISTTDENGAALNGAVYTLEDGTGEALRTDEAREEEVTFASTAGGDTAASFAPGRYRAFAGMAADEERTLRVAETTVPAGYISTGAAFEQNTGAPVQTLTIIKKANGSFSIKEADTEGYTLKFLHRKASALTLTLTTTDDNTDKPKALAGAQYTVKTSDGQVLKKRDGSEALYESTSIGQPQTIILDETANPELAALKNAGTSARIVISELKLPSGSYRFKNSAVSDGTGQTAGGMDIALTVTRTFEGQLAFALPGADGKISYAARLDLTFVHSLQSALTTGDGIQVVKKIRWLKNGKLQPLYAVQDLDYYFALFSDSAKTQRVSEVKTLTVKRGYDSGMVRYSGLTGTKYYAAETDRYGNVLTEKAVDEPGAPFAVYYKKSENGKNFAHGNGFAVSFASKSRQETAKAEFANVYDDSAAARKPDYFSQKSTVRFNISKSMLKKDGSANAGTETVHFRMEDAATGSKITSGSYKFRNTSQASIAVDIRMSKIGKDVKVKVTETDTEGKYSVSYAPEAQTVTPKTYEQADGGKNYETIAVANRLTSDSVRPDPAETDNYGDGRAKLTLTKKVTFKGRPMAVNSVYYIGIWRDSSMSGKPYYIRPLTFQNASTVTASLTINLNRAESHAVTFYFAEVDKNGTKVSSGKAFGYDISQNKASVTLNASNMSDEVVFTNSIVSGSATAQQLTDPSSGFAGDSAALAEAQELAKTGNAGAKTGDASPLLPLAAGLGISAAVIIVLLVIRAKRRRKEKENG